MIRRTVLDCSAMFWRTAAAVLILFAAGTAHADERILHFTSNIRINHDSSVDVIETFDVQVEHSSITHEFDRLFPSLDRRKFALENATIDSKPAPTLVTPFRQGTGVSVAIGNPYRIIKRGRHHFELRYQATDQISHLKDFDEVSWNATGSAWSLPIDLADVSILLPPEAKLLWHSSDIGGADPSGRGDVTFVNRGSRGLVFEARHLQPNQNLIVAAAFPKGILTTTPRIGGKKEWLSGPPILGAVCLLLLLLLYFAAWYRIGRHRPRAGTTVPIYAPPDGLSPAAMRYVVKMKCDDRTAAAALVDLAVRGYVHLNHGYDERLFRDVVRLRRELRWDSPPAEELAYLDELALPGQTITIGPENFGKLCDAKDELNASLKARYRNVLFRPHWEFGAAGLVMLFGALALTASAVVASVSSSDSQIVGLGFIMVVAMGLLWHRPWPHSPAAQTFTSVALFVLSASTFLLAVIMIPAALATGWWQPMAIPLLGLPVVISSFWWMATPTKKGRVVLDHIAGFKAYLTIAERERLDHMTVTPKDKPDEFERYLAYAIALDVENHWADRFQSLLTGSTSLVRQSFGWYSGAGVYGFIPAFVDAVGMASRATQLRPRGRGPQSLETESPAILSRRPQVET